MAPLLGAVLSVTGCASHEGTSEYTPNAQNAAPVESVGPSAPPSSPSRTDILKPGPSKLAPSKLPPLAVPVKPTPAASPSASARVNHAPQRDLDDYMAEVMPILRAGDAETRFRTAIQNAPSAIESKKLGAFVPIYSDYAKAVRQASEKLAALKPPAGVGGLHIAFRAYIDGMADNLEQTVKVLKQGDGAKADALTKELPHTVRSGETGILNAIKAGGFDVDAFRTRGILRYPA